jgi:uncharacterized protein
MSEKFIPEHIDPYRFAEQSLELDGFVKISDMSRLLNSVNSAEGLANVHLQFGIDQQGLTYLKGNIKADLTLQCQRCMEPFIYEIISDFALGIVSTLDEANALPGHYEPALAKEGSLALRELIEDELILNLPIIPRHDPNVCKAQFPADDEKHKESNTNPFHVLASLKVQKQKNRKTE